MHMIRHEIDQLQSAKAGMEELRECVERLEEEQRRRKARSVDQVRARKGTRRPITQP